ncbi:hypothetical protein [Photobacterium jeanii]|nr:hypothetical protein [Photobacterium jeanii]
MKHSVLKVALTLLVTAPTLFSISHASSSTAADAMPVSAGSTAIDSKLMNAESTKQQPMKSPSSLDDERLLQSLIKRGVICSGLSPEEQATALNIYMQQKLAKQQNKNKPKVQNSQQQPKETPSCISPLKSNKA